MPWGKENTRTQTSTHTCTRARAHTHTHAPQINGHCDITPAKCISVRWRWRPGTQTVASRGQPFKYHALGYRPRRQHALDYHPLRYHALGYLTTECVRACGDTKDLRSSLIRARQPSPIHTTWFQLSQRQGKQGSGIYHTWGDAVRNQGDWGSISIFFVAAPLYTINIPMNIPINMRSI